MDNMPQDPFMLVSYINMKLRDKEFDSLESLCKYYERNTEDIKVYLSQFGFEYLEAQKQFR
jgi:hypothetical protein